MPGAFLILRDGALPLLRMTRFLEFHLDRVMPGSERNERLEA